MSYTGYIPGSLLADAPEPTREELANRVAELEAENRALKAKLDNRKKLTTRDVTLIKRFGRTTGLTHREIAEMFGLNRATVSRILNGTYHKDAA